MGYNTSGNQVKASGSNEQKLIIGTDTAKVLSVKLGIQEKDDVKVRSLQFWLKSTLGGSANHNITVSAKDREASKLKEDGTGNDFEFIDQFGSTGWGKTLETIGLTYSYVDKKTGNIVEGKRAFDFSTGRRAKVGEVALTQFIRTLFNKAKDSPTYDKLSEFTGASDFIKLIQEDSALLKELNEAIKTDNKELFVNYTVYTKNDGSLGNRVIPVFASSLTSPVNFNKELIKYADRQAKSGYPIKDEYNFLNAIEYGTKQVSASVASKVEKDFSDLPF